MPPKSAADLRSASRLPQLMSLGDGRRKIHRLYMRLSMLSMERERVLKERDVALAKIERCDSRCKQINGQIDQLNQSLSVVEGLPPAEEKKEEPAKPPRHRRRIHHRY